VDQLTIDQFKEALPATLKKSVNKELIDKINTTLSDPDMYETYRDNMLSYTKVMSEGKFKTTNYIDAVKYVSHKMMGKTNIAAFTDTFPEKIQRWNQTNVSSKDIASYVTAYNKSKLVTLIMEQTLVPMWVLNQDLAQRAVNTLADLMTNANSEKVRSDSASSLLTHLKMPESSKIELDIKTSEDSSLTQLRQSTMDLVAAQRQMIQAGAMNAQEVAHSKVIDAEVIEG
jgi:hypothetical protein